MTGSQLDDRLGTMVLNRLRTDDREISGSLTRRELRPNWSKRENPVFLTKRAGKKRFQSGIDTEGVARGTIPEGNEV